MVAGDRAVDLRRLAGSLGGRRCGWRAARRERLTGLRVGGIGALALVGQPFGPASTAPPWPTVAAGQQAAARASTCGSPSPTWSG